MTKSSNKNQTEACISEAGCRIYRHENMANLAAKGSRSSITKEYFTYEVYLERDILDAYCYTELCNLLRYSESIDCFNFYLSGYGGDSDGMAAIIAAIDDSCSKIIMKVITGCYSAHSLLALCGDGLEFRQGAFLMFHNYSASLRGKGAELIAQIKVVDGSLREYARSLQLPFLTPEECDRIDHDKDVYIKWNDKHLLQRCKRHFK